MADTQCPQLTPDDHTTTLETEHLNDYSGGPGRGGQLLVNAASQWLHATTGRIATCAHSWMQAVHWMSGSGLYTPSRAHGPKWGTTTLAVAREISALTECRPGVDYLARKLRISERTVQYHLGMLREAGLLVYRSKGTRIHGVGGRASVFERIIPTAFDEALGIRTVGEGATRRPVGAAPEHRKALGQLAKKAARKIRRTRRRPTRTPVSDRRLCTPMQGGTSGTSSAAGTHFPSESKLASGEAESPTRKSPKRGPRTLNKTGRRYQLARELIQLVPWLGRASAPRIAWIVRHVADAGWTALEVQAVAEWEPVHADDARRPSGLLAYRLGNRHQLFDTPAKRRTAVQVWQDSRTAEQARHSGYDQPARSGGPQSVAARRAVDEAFNAIRDRLTADAADIIPVEETTTRLEDLTRDEVIQMRADAARDHGLIFAAIDLLGERDARRLYTNRLVDQALALQAIADRNATYTPAF
ncbi:helix-turn-helix domain-containing protein [Streptomyces scabiei]|uniref:helix-turn-helix domain-containing protein n=1 Tax=Streptomyces scabiei TaxID=1930 RepID=UPI0038F7B9D9